MREIRTLRATGRGLETESCLPLGTSFPVPSDLQIVQEYGTKTDTCPAGSIPKRHVTLDQVMRFATLDQFLGNWGSGPKRKGFPTTAGAAVPYSMRDLSMLTVVRR